MSSVATQWLPKKKNPLQIVDLQGINFLYPYPGPVFSPHFLQPSATKVLDFQHLIFSYFLKKDLVLSLFATLLLPKISTQKHLYDSFF